MYKEYFYILKEGWYYRSGAHGYTEHKYEAGVFEKNEAIIHEKNCNKISLIPIDVDKHNEMIENKIQEIKNNKI